MLRAVLFTFVDIDHKCQFLSVISARIHTATLTFNTHSVIGVVLECLFTNSAVL